MLDGNNELVWGKPKITRTLHDRMSVNKTMEGSKIVICRNRLSDLRLITDLSTVGDTIAAYR